MTLVNTPANQQAKGLILQPKRQTVLSQGEAAMAKSDTLSSMVDWQALELERAAYEEVQPSPRTLSYKHIKTQWLSDRDKLKLDLQEGRNPKQYKIMKTLYIKKETWV